MRIETLRDLYSYFPDIDGYWDFDNVFKTEFHITNLLPKEGEGWSLSEIESLTQLARVQTLTGRFPQARITLEKAKSLIEGIDTPHQARPFIRYFLEQGRLLGLEMTPVKAAPVFQKALTLALEIKDDYFAVEATLMMAMCQPPKFQHVWLQRALDLAKSSADARAQLWLGQLYLLDGWHKFDFKQFAEALESFEKAVQQPRVLGDSNQFFSSKWSLARGLRALGRCDEALLLQKQLHSEPALSGTASGYVSLEIGECLQALQEHEEAKPHFEAAHKILSKDTWYSDNKASDLTRMLFLAKRH
jgi:tetratricopeptide (TPR) repeat protein